MAEKQPNKSSISVLSDYLLCLFLFVLINIVLFHTGLYGYLCIVDSYAGNVHGRLSILTELEQKHDDDLIAVIGDSTTEHGIGAQELSEFTDKPVANLALPGTCPREWLYFLKSIDPDRNRFETLVITIVPHNINSRPHDDGVQTLLPVASIEEMVSYAWQFEQSTRKMEYAYGAFDKIFGFRRDLRNLFLSPDRFFTIQKEKQNQLKKLRNWQGEKFDVCEVQLHPQSGVITDWGEIDNPKIRPIARNALNRIAQLNHRPAISGIQKPLDEIVSYYNGSTTRIVVVTIPFGIGHSLRRNTKPVREYYKHLRELNALENFWHWNAVHEPLFQDCRNFYDFRHLNARGRKIFTQRLAAELRDIDLSEAKLINKKQMIKDRDAFQ
jgi:hypothetical protein